jgi:hypothetical protein
MMWKVPPGAFPKETPLMDHVFSLLTLHGFEVYVPVKGRCHCYWHGLFDFASRTMSVLLELISDGAQYVYKPCRCFKQPKEKVIIVRGLSLT